MTDDRIFFLYLKVTYDVRSNVMPSLPEHKPKAQYKIHFITIEREPGAELRDSVMEICRNEWKDATMRKVYVETSDDGYCHYHVIVRTPKPSRWEKARKRLQQDPRLAQWKWNLHETGDKDKRNISVRFFHTRLGSLDDAESLRKYVEDPQYKSKNVDGEPLIWEADPLAMAEAGLCWATEEKITTCLRCTCTMREGSDFFFDQLMCELGRQVCRERLMANHEMAAK